VLLGVGAVELVASLNVVVIDADKVVCPRTLFECRLVKVELDHAIWTADVAMM
jgi:hypothetical protein